MFGSSLYITFILLTFTTTVFPQQREEKSDSTSQQKIPFQYYLLNYQLMNENSFRISPESLFPINNLVKENRPSSVWLQREIASKELSDKIVLENKLPSVLTRPLTLKYQREETSSLVLGILAKLKDLLALYLLYKHIQKYGLFHQP